MRIGASNRSVKRNFAVNSAACHLTDLADKGFLIQYIVPKGVSVNISPFLEHGKFTESEAKLTKSIASCRIHDERANARLKDFKILSFVPPYLGFAKSRPAARRPSGPGARRRGGPVAQS